MGSLEKIYDFLTSRPVKMLKNLLFRDNRYLLGVVYSIYFYEIGMLIYLSVTNVISFYNRQEYQEYEIIDSNNKTYLTINEVGSEKDCGEYYQPEVRKLEI